MLFGCSDKLQVGVVCWAPCCKCLSVGLSTTLYVGDGGARSKIFNARDGILIFLTVPEPPLA